MITKSFWGSARSQSALKKGFQHAFASYDLPRLASTAVLPDLPYDYSALEPVISGEIMELHHSKHHKAYVTNFNVALEKYEEAENKKDFSSQISLQSALKFNGGGHINHSIFWKNLAPISQGGGELPTGSLASKIESDFGSIDKLISEISTVGGAVQGSGWVWLGLNKGKDRLIVQTTPNQDPLITTGLIPLLGIDVWEHAYYLQYKNVRPDYLKNIWKVINWKDVAERYEAASKQ